MAEDLEDLRGKLAVARGALGEGAARVHQPAGVYISLAPLVAEGELAFLFPGQGSQFVGMGREVALAFPEARRCLERADAVLAGCHPQPLSRYILPLPSFTDEERARRQGELTQTEVAQPALGAVELGYLHVLRALGVTPQMTAGHSYGEFVALAAAGSLGEDDLLRVSEARGRFIREESGERERGDGGGRRRSRGARRAGRRPRARAGQPQRPAADRAVGLLGGHRARAAVVSRARSERAPTAGGLRVSLALRGGRAAAPGRTARADDARPPAVPVFSNTTATAHPADPAAITATLARHLVEPVAFADEIDAMYEAGARIFLEVGPRNVLTGLVDRILGERPHVAVAVDQSGRSGLVQLIHALAALGVEGVELSAERLFRGRRAAAPEPAHARAARGASGPLAGDLAGERWAGPARRPAAHSRQSPTTAHR